MEGISQYDFEATHDDELSFKRGDILKVKNMEDKNWYQAEVTGRKGFIPSTYVQMEDHVWYKGKMSRTEAEALLMRRDRSGHDLHQDGSFVIRDCESDKNQFSLSVKHGCSSQHFKILSNADGNYYLWPNKVFPSINKLIDYHRTVSIAREPRITILLRDMQEPSKSSHSQLFEAQHDFSPESPEEVCFKRGDRIRLLEKTDENWWTGLVVSTNEQGLFPCNYVKEIK